MRPFTVLTGVAAPLLRPNIDTDAIIPSREMTTVSKSGLAAGLFAGWRYASIGSRSPDPGFVLNHPAYAGATILLGGENFGCGSSREHAVWALAEYGFRAIVAPSFSPIFHQNCIRNGVLPAIVERESLAEIASLVARDPGVHRVTIDLPLRTISVGDSMSAAFLISDEARTMLLDGADAVDLTLRVLPSITVFKSRFDTLHPWVDLAERHERE
jgi:3-isopropylmalate/(R)-2-methylmalate dehydratase small subunit